MIDFCCPACQKRYLIPDERAGTMVSCLQCGAAARVPGVPVPKGPPAPKAPPVPAHEQVVKTAGEVGARVAQAGRGLMSKIAEAADKVGNIAGEAVSYDHALAADASKPAIFLREQYFGGRGNIGGSLSQLRTLGGLIMAVLFSFAYLGWVLSSSLSSWQFLPYSKTELVRITLRQKLRWEKLLPILIGWVLTMAAGLVICFFWAWFVNKLFELFKPASEGFLDRLLGSLASLSLVVLAVFYGFANLVACKKVAALNNYTRSCIILDYGFPNKTRLLMGVSDAPVEKQIDGVLALCDAISKATFTPWEQMGANRNLGIRTYLASLARKFTGQ